MNVQQTSQHHPKVDELVQLLIGLQQFFQIVHFPPLPTLNKYL